MGQAVHEHAMSNGYTVVQEIGGHGIGLQIHEEPWVSHVSKKGTEMLLVGRGTSHAMLTQEYERSDGWLAASYDWDGLSAYELLAFEWKTMSIYVWIIKGGGES